MAYTRKDFGENPWESTPRNAASSRGWGSGWPHCQTSKMRVAAGGGVRVWVRKEIVDLVVMLLDATAAMGYQPKIGQTWGFACRAIRGSNVASNHSWGLAVDINSLTNPMGTRFKTDMPPRVVKMWQDCGFAWGGHYRNRPDAMHFELVIRPEDVPKYETKARAYLAAATGKGPAEKPVVPKPDVKPEPDAKPDVKLGARVLKPGMQGADVALLQRFLGRDEQGNRLEADGKYGAKTEGAVRRYQRVRGLIVDGIAGPKTLGPIVKAVGL